MTTPRRRPATHSAHPLGPARRSTPPHGRGPGRGLGRTRAAGAAVVAGLVGVVGLVALLTAPAASAASYRYWSFWSGGSNGSWTYQQQGPNTNIPADGSVDGWRFGVSADSANASRPRRDADFAAVCGTTAAVSGKKRVAVVIDYGTAADSGTGAVPPAERSACAVLDKDASSAQALAELAPPLRYDANGILCAISGYPRRGCGEVVAGNGTGSAATAATGATTGATTATAAQGGDRGGSGGATLGWAAGAALVAALAGGAWYQRHRRERGQRGD